MRSEAPHRSVDLPGLRPGEGSRIPDGRARAHRGAPRAGGVEVCRGGSHGSRVGLALIGLLVWLVTLAGPASGQTLMTQEEALALAFPGDTTVDRRSAYLTDGELDRARALAGNEVDIDQTIVTYYVGHQDGAKGAAYFDVHRVRTKNEVVMVVVDPNATIRRVDVLSFAEPPEYRAPAGWIDQLEGRGLDQALSLRGGIRSIAGATLTARSLTEAVRRVLALHAVIQPFGATP